MRCRGCHLQKNGIPALWQVLKHMPWRGAQLKRDCIGRKANPLKFDILTCMQSAEPSKRLNKQDQIRMNVAPVIILSS